MSVRHLDFERILSAFIKRYGVDGEKEYQHWLSVMKLDETLPYGSPPKESFSWAKCHIQRVKEDEKAKWYKVEALFPWTSMNANKYTDEELASGTRTLVGKPNNLNHTVEILPIDLPDAQYENKVSEVLARIPKDAVCSAGNLCELIDNAETNPKGIMHVSIEAHGVRPDTLGADGSRQCNGLQFDGLAWLTKDVLPGVPVTRIQPFEQLLECLGCPGCGSKAQAAKEEKNKLENTPKEGKSHECQNSERLAKLEAKLVELTKPEIDIMNTIGYLRKQLDDSRKQIDDLNLKLAAKTDKPVDTTSIQGQETDVLSREGYWKRFNHLRDEGASKQEAFRLVAMEVLTAIEKKSH